ncbi:GH1 family beta-glucosidase [Nocardioides limicola]|uniref:GH1 family beta-glucosidase n=1 Tax=Nocardioides limicola TaxID=2803368 RepID=UPI00193BACEF|nr:GH1 family beta-glucosidase [Nocardioides sp. DJM-14]
MTTPHSLTGVHPSHSDRATFGSDFLWGSATAAYQIEGAAWQDGRTDSIWDAFARRPGAVFGGHDGSVAVDHYHRYAADVALMADLNLGAYRFSTSWARVCPDGGPPNAAGLDFYSRLVDELLDRNILPWLTLYHWDLPQALEDAGGWAARDTAYRFADYARAVHDVLGDRVRHWTTLNEPWCSAMLGYAAGEHAPGRTEPVAALRATHHLLLAHGLGVQALRAEDPTLSLGLTLNFNDIAPADPDSAADLDAARRADGMMNRLFLDPVFHGAYPTDVLEDLTDLWPADLVHDGDLATIATPIDVLGVNYYSCESVTGPDPATARQAAAAARAAGPSARVGSEHVRSVPRGLPATAQGWEVYPAGLTALLQRLHEYAAPAGVQLYVTENGAAYDDAPDALGFVDDTDRTAYIRAHLHAVLAAIRAGVDVRGYFVWSLLDNFEWAWGYAKRFGIVRVDYATLDRTPKASARWYAGVARSGRLD